MRSELELMEKTEQYLSGKLSAADTAAFEQEMAGDPARKAAVALQRDIMMGIGRAVVRRQVQYAGQAYHAKKKLLRFGVGAAVVLTLITTATLFVIRRQYAVPGKSAASTAYSNTALPTLNELGKPEWVMADSLIPAQLFNLTAGKDTVIETSGGMVLSVPADAFVDAAGKAAIGTLSLVIKEAFDPATIMQAGLGTRSGPRLLETGGMFFVDARQGNSILGINSANGIYAVIPGDAAKPGMQLFSGRRMPNGSIDWQDPKPLSHDLLAVDILSLDFYPPDYFKLLHKNGFSTGSKNFTDSVYYSLAALFNRDDQNSIDRAGLNNDEVSDSAKYVPHEGKEIRQIDCGINPAKIKTIWSARFQNTLLATREFEQRLKLIHRSKNPALLDLYVNNLGKNLYEIDAMAADKSGGEIRSGFLQFAAQHDGKVKHGSVPFDKLRDYYALKTKLLTGAIAKTQEQIMREENRTDHEAAGKRIANEMENSSRIAKNFSEELSINLESAYQQLGYPKPKLALNMPAITYAATITNTGWCNVDRYVLESTTNRTTLDYTDPNSGKRAVIAYKPITINIADSKAYDRLLVYLIPDKLSSYMSLAGSDGTFTESLNGLMKYDLVCIGIKGSQQSYLKLASVAPQTYDGLSLKPMPAKAVAIALNSIPGQEGAFINKAVDYAIWDLQNIELQQQRRKWQEMIDDLTRSFFPCSIQEEEESAINSDAVAQPYDQQ